MYACLRRTPGVSLARLGPRQPGSKKQQKCLQTAQHTGRTPLTVRVNQFVDVWSLLRLEKCSTRTLAACTMVQGGGFKPGQSQSLCTAIHTKKQSSDVLARSTSSSQRPRAASQSSSVLLRQPRTWSRPSACASDAAFCHGSLQHPADRGPCGSQGVRQGHPGAKGRRQQLEQTV